MGSGNDNSTKVLLHCEGSNGATTFTDGNFGGSAHTWSQIGTATIATAASKFGSASLNCGAAAGAISAPDSADFTFGSGAFTIDCWFNRQGGDGTTRFICGQSNSAGSGGFSYLLNLNTSNQIRFAWSANGTTVSAIVSTTTFTATGWHHVAAIRTGNTFRLFIDGTQEGGDTSDSSTLNDSSNALAVGAFGELPGLYWYGYIDEFRISVGTARWTTTFTPPTAAYSIADLSAAVGSLALTGKVANFFSARKHVAGAYTLTGNSVTLTKAWKALTAVVGAYALTGVASTRKIARSTLAGAYALTGFTTTRQIVRSSLAGAYVLTGYTSHRGFLIIAAAGSYVLTGVQALLVRVVAPINKFVVRVTEPILYRTRRAAPTLED